MTVQKTKTAARCAALFLSMLLCGLALFADSRPAKAADWMEPYLEQVVEWGVMRGDSSGNLNADREITRAEFVTLINRAFGYTETGPNPFSDVLPTDWFAEDIIIAYQAGYFNGTTPSTASPMKYVTREQAAALLGRSLRLEGAAGSGSNSTFEDGNQIGTWSRDLVQEATDLGIIQGYADGTFRPTEHITRGQVACFLVRALGTLINEPGEQSAGGVYGNLTINTAGVKLKDTTITGNLYLTGGVGLGNVELENVNVLGKIVLCGAGEAEKGENSVVLRNVTADSFIVDSLTDQFLTVRAEGLTDIANTTVRTSSYLEDVTDDGLGLRFITLDGDSGVQLQLAGNIKEVLNISPNSDLQIVQGVANTVTMDEKATGAKLNIDNSATIRDLNLDVGAPVTGTGSIGHLNVNAAGSNVETLPDTLAVRPGINATVNKQPMNSVAAAESSEDPRLLSGYPTTKDVAPTSATAVFSANKTGTIYWGLSALTDGSLNEEQLVNPSAYSARILQSGTLNITASNTEFTAKITSLTKDGSYYVSAMLVDARGRRSPVKVTAFTTPDDTTPAFASGYPYTILTTDRDGEQVLQVMAMATKDCQMYYALLPNNSSAPTQAELKAAAVTGNLGYGVVDVKRNTPLLIPKVNTSYLEEQTTYNLYLWLNDADNGKSSSIVRLQVTTLDLTPPTITSLTFQESAARTATFTVTLDEPGTLYWAVVKSGAQFYAAVPGENRFPEPEETIAKIQIENGTNAIKKGSVNVAKAATEVRFTISGLEAQTHYDLYFVAKDKAGNYNIYTESLTPPIDFSTLDNVPPTVAQEFTHDGTDEGQRNPTPYPDTDINLVFSEMVQGMESVNGVPVKEPFLDLYTAVASAPSGSAAEQEAKDKMAETLRKYITLWYRPATGQPEEVPVKGDPDVGDDWVIDYREAIIQMDPEGTGEMILTFPNSTGLQLGSGVTYYFTLENIADTSQAANRMQGTRGVVTLPDFTTIDAQLYITPGTATGSINGQNIVFDMNFRLTPEGTSNVTDDTLWDIIFWADESLAFELYCNTGNGWSLLGEAEINTNIQQPRSGISITNLLNRDSVSGIPNFEQLNRVTGIRDYGIIITRRNDSTARDTWTGDVDLTIVPVAGDLSCLSTLAGKNLTPSTYQSHQNSNYAVREIGSPKEYTVSHPFTDTEPPTFIEGYPLFTPTDSGVTIEIMSSRDNCKYFCIVTQVGGIPTTVDGITGSINLENWGQLPGSGFELPTTTAPGNATSPSTTSVTNGTTYIGPTYRIRNGSCGRRVTTVSISPNDSDGGLEASKEYIAYIVLQGDSPTSASKVYAFRFKTEAVTRPVLTVTLNSPRGTIQSNREAQVWYALVTAGTTEPPFSLTLADCATVGVNGWDASLISRYGNTSVLEAMRLDAPSGMTGSLFDAYADLDNSNTMQIVTLIKNSGSSGGVLSGPGTANLTNSNNLQTTPDFSQFLVNNAEYWLVAIGQCQGTSGHAFRSNRYLRNTDKTPPQVNSLNTSITSGTIYTSDKRTEALSTPYSGTFYISFTEALWYRESSEVRKKIVDIFPLTDTSGRYMSSISLLGAGNSQFGISHRLTNVTDWENPPDCMDLQITFENCRVGDTITFDANLCDENNNPGDRPLALTLTLVEEVSGTGADRVTILRPTFTYSNSTIQSIWGGTTVRN